jgi:hypothetical protein
VAKKSRTPPPPRKVQSPQQRRQERAGLTDRQKLWILSGFAGLGLVGVAVAVTLIASSRGASANDKGVAQLLAKAGCSYKIYPATSQAHLASLKSKIPKYNSFPASNGPHYYQPAPWGNYSDTVPQIVGVHNLEHGGILIEWGNKVPQADRDAIDAFYGESSNGMLVFPYPPLGKRIALIAWTADLKRLSSNRTKGYHGEGRVAICTHFDETAFKTFQSRFRAKGPERFPLSALKPGA